MLLVSWLLVRVFFFFLFRASLAFFCLHLLRIFSFVLLVFYLFLFFLRPLSSSRTGRVERVFVSCFLLPSFSFVFVASFFSFCLYFITAFVPSSPLPLLVVKWKGRACFRFLLLPLFSSVCFVCLLSCSFSLYYLPLFLLPPSPPRREPEGSSGLSNGHITQVVPPFFMGARRTSAEDFLSLLQVRTTEDRAPPYVFFLLLIWTGCLCGYFCAKDFRLLV